MVRIGIVAGMVSSRTQGPSCGRPATPDALHSKRTVSGHLMHVQGVASPRQRRRDERLSRDLRASGLDYYVYLVEHESASSPDPRSGELSASEANGRRPS